MFFLDSLASNWSVGHCQRSQRSPSSVFTDQLAISSYPMNVDFQVLVSMETRILQSISGKKPSAGELRSDGKRSRVRERRCYIINCVAIFYEEGKGGENFRKKNKFRCKVNPNEKRLSKIDVVCKLGIL